MPVIRDASVIRDARPEDLPVLTEIYNHAVFTTANFDLEPQSLERRKTWMDAHGELHPLIVLETDGAVLGYCGILPWRMKPAYASTVEVSIYVHPDAKGKGVGTRLMEEMIRRARALGHHAILATINGMNEASVRLHRRFGFERVGVLREVGRKFGKWQDVHVYQLILSE
jgi:L-amino acid N-acyltransferase YncA